MPTTLPKPYRTDVANQFENVFFRFLELNLVNEAKFTFSNGVGTLKEQLHRAVEGLGDGARNVVLTIDGQEVKLAITPIPENHEKNKEDGRSGRKYQVAFLGDKKDSVRKKVNEYTSKEKIDILSGKTFVFAEHNGISAFENILEDKDKKNQYVIGGITKKENSEEYETFELFEDRINELNVFIEKLRNDEATNHNFLSTLATGSGKSFTQALMLLAISLAGKSILIGVPGFAEQIFRNFKSCLPKKITDKIEIFEPKNVNTLKKEIENLVSYPIPDTQKKKILEVNIQGFPFDVILEREDEKQRVKVLIKKKSYIDYTNLENYLKEKKLNDWILKSFDVSFDEFSKELDEKHGDEKENARNAVLSSYCVDKEIKENQNYIIEHKYLFDIDVCKQIKDKKGLAVTVDEAHEIKGEESNFVKLGIYAGNLFATALTATPYERIRDFFPDLDIHMSFLKKVQSGVGQIPQLQNAEKFTDSDVINETEPFIFTRLLKRVFNRFFVNSSYEKNLAYQLMHKMQDTFFLAKDDATLKDLDVESLSMDQAREELHKFFRWNLHLPLTNKILFISETPIDEIEDILTQGLKRNRYDSQLSGCEHAKSAVINFFRGEGLKSTLKHLDENTLFDEEKTSYRRFLEKREAQYKERLQKEIDKLLNDKEFKLKDLAEKAGYSTKQEIMTFLKQNFTLRCEVAEQQKYNTLHNFIELLLSDILGKHPIELNQLRKKDLNKFCDEFRIELDKHKKELVDKEITSDNKIHNYFLNRLQKKYKKINGNSSISYKLHTVAGIYKNLYLNMNQPDGSVDLKEILDNSPLNYKMYDRLRGEVKGDDENYEPTEREKDLKEYLDKLPECIFEFSRKYCRAGHSSVSNSTPSPAVFNLAEEMFELFGNLANNERFRAYSNSKLNCIAATVSNKLDALNKPENVIQFVGRNRGLDKTKIPFCFFIYKDKIQPTFDVNHLITKDDYYPEFFAGEKKYSEFCLDGLADKVSSEVEGFVKSVMSPDGSIDLEKVNQFITEQIIEAEKQIYIDTLYDVNLTKERTKVLLNKIAKKLLSLNEEYKFKEAKSLTLGRYALKGWSKLTQISDFMHVNLWMKTKNFLGYIKTNVFGFGNKGNEEQNQIDKLWSKIIQKRSLDSLSYSLFLKDELPEIFEPEDLRFYLNKNLNNYKEKRKNQIMESLKKLSDDFNYKNIPFERERDVFLEIEKRLKGLTPENCNKLYERIAREVVSDSSVFESEVSISNKYIEVLSKEDELFSPEQIEFLKNHTKESFVIFSPCLECLRKEEVSESVLFDKKVLKAKKYEFAKSILAGAKIGTNTFFSILGKAISMGRHGDDEEDLDNPASNVFFKFPVDDVFQEVEKVLINRIDELMEDESADKVSIQDILNYDVIGNILLLKFHAIHKFFQKNPAVSKSQIKEILKCIRSGEDPVEAFFGSFSPDSKTGRKLSPETIKYFEEYFSDEKIDSFFDFIKKVDLNENLVKIVPKMYEFLKEYGMLNGMGDYIAPMIREKMQGPLDEVQEVLVKLFKNEEAIKKALEKASDGLSKYGKVSGLVTSGFSLISGVAKFSGYAVSGVQGVVAAFQGGESSSSNVSKAIEFVEKISGVLSELNFNKKEIEVLTTFLENARTKHLENTKDLSEKTLKFIQKVNGYPEAEAVDRVGKLLGRKEKSEERKHDDCKHDDTVVDVKRELGNLEGLQADVYEQLRNVKEYIVRAQSILNEEAGKHRFTVSTLEGVLNILEESSIVNKVLSVSKSLDAKKISECIQFLKKWESRGREGSNNLDDIERKINFAIEKIQSFEMKKATDLLRDLKELFNLIKNTSGYHQKQISVVSFLNRKKYFQHYLIDKIAVISDEAIEEKIGDKCSKEMKQELIQFLRSLNEDNVESVFQQKIKPSFVRKVAEVMNLIPLGVREKERGAYLGLGELMKDYNFQRNINLCQIKKQEHIKENAFSEAQSEKVISFLKAKPVRDSILKTLGDFSLKEINLLYQSIEEQVIDSEYKYSESKDIFNFIQYLQHEDYDAINKHFMKKCEEDKSDFFEYKIFKVLNQIQFLQKEVVRVHGKYNRLPSEEIYLLSNFVGFKDIKQSFIYPGAIFALGEHDSTKDEDNTKETSGLTRLVSKDVYNQRKFVLDGKEMFINIVTEGGNLFDKVLNVFKLKQEMKFYNNKKERKVIKAFYHTVRAYSATFGDSSYKDMCRHMYLSIARNMKKTIKGVSTRIKAFYIRVGNFISKEKIGFNRNGYSIFTGGLSKKQDVNGKMKQEAQAISKKLWNLAPLSEKEVLEHNYRDAFQKLLKEYKKEKDENKKAKPP